MGGRSAIAAWTLAAFVSVVTLVATGLAAAGGDPSRNGAILYATNAAQNSDQPFVYLVDPQSGSRQLVLHGSFSKDGTALALSPDGRKIIYGQGAKIYVRDLAEPAPVELPRVGDQTADGDFAWAPDSSRFVLSAWDGPREGLYTARADGSGLLQLAPGRTMFAAWSPDGRRIAFGDGQCLRIVDAAGGAPSDCVASMSQSVVAHLDGLAWSPDGRTVAATGLFRCAADMVGCGETVLVDVDLRQAHPLPGGEGLWGSVPAWSPDGTMLAFAFGGVVIVDVETGSRRTLAKDWNPSEVVWSPDGTMLAYVRGEGRAGLGVVRVDRGDRKLLYPNDFFRSIHWSRQGIVASAFTAHGDYEIVVGAPDRPLTKNVADDQSPAVSPDGRLVAYTEGPQSRDGRLFGLSDEDGTIVVRALDGGRPLRLVRGRDPSWSPDGAALAFERHVTGCHGWTDILMGAVYVVDVAAGARPRLLSRCARSPAWSPDGRTIAFAPDSQSLGLIDPDGRHKRFLRTPGLYHDDPAWSPDGRWIAYEVGANDQHGNSRFWLEAIHPDGTGRRVLTAFGRVLSPRVPAWSPDGKSILIEADTEPLEDSAAIYELRVDGRWPIPLADARLLTPPGVAQNRWPAWQPRCTIYGTPGPDTLIGTSGPDVICGLGGNDTIKAGAGNDVVIGGDGNDRIDGGPGRDRLFGARGNDTITARDRTRDVVDGGPGRDTAARDKADLVRLIER